MVPVVVGAYGYWCVSQGKLVASDPETGVTILRKGKFQTREGKLPWMGCDEAKLLRETMHQNLGHPGSLIRGHLAETIEFRSHFSHQLLGGRCLLAYPSFLPSFNNPDCVSITCQVLH